MKKRQRNAEKAPPNLLIQQSNQVMNEALIDHKTDELTL